MNLKIDLSYLNEVSDGDNDFIISILDTLTKEAPKDIEQLNQAIEANDISSIGSLAHKNKATLQLLGLLELKELAFEIEQAAKREDSSVALVPQAVTFREHLSNVVGLATQELSRLS